MKLTEYRSYMYCRVCGRDLKDKQYRLPYGAPDKYCLKHAGWVETTKARRLKAARSPESRADIMLKRREGWHIKQIADVYGVSYTAIYQIIQEERHGRNQMLPAGDTYR